MFHSFSDFHVAWIKFAIAVSCALLLSNFAAADEHRHRDREFHDHEFREHEFRDRAFIDSRYHHEHYYPPRGYLFGALPREHHVVIFGGVRYFFGAGIWYRRHNEHFIVVAPPLGVIVPVLPPAYATVWVGGAPYYYANNVFYVRQPAGYVVVQDPPSNMIVEQAPASPVVVEQNPASRTSGVVELGHANATNARSSAVMPQAPVVAATITPQLFVYPRQGQSPDLQTKDRNECHVWAVSQVGSDPNSAANPRLGDYQRALGACLDGRGYMMK
jgi:hypothetical protein